MSDAPRRLRFLSYAVNGGGVGHLVRQVAIQRWLRRLCAFAGTKSEHWFLTTSEADTLCFHEGFSAFKLPSKTIVEDAGLDKAAYIAMAKQWVWSSLTLLRPDGLLVDTFPNGSFHELANALDVVDKKVLVLRPVKQPFARRAAYQSLVQLYDRVVVPEHEDDEPGLLDELGLPSARVSFVGPVMRSEKSDQHSRAQARARLGVVDDSDDDVEGGVAGAGAAARRRAVVVVTGGGGGDRGIDAFFDACARALAGQHVHIVWAAGPLFRGAPRRGPHETFFVGHDLAEHLAGVDVAICAAGFNTIHELLHAGVPTVVVPQDKIADDQAARAARYAARGALLASSAATLAADVDAVLTDAARRQALTVGARRAVPENHARDAAAAVLSLWMTPSVLRAACASLDDAVLSALGAAPALGRGPAISVGDVVDLAVALQAHGDRAALDSDAVLAAATLSTSTSTPPLTLVKVIEQLKKKVRVDDAAALVQRLLEAPAFAGQPVSVLALVSALVPERGLDGAVVVDAVIDAADRAASAGKDAAALARALPSVVVPPAFAHASTNLARLRAAAAALSSSTSTTTTTATSTTTTTGRA